jgi:hypothetical protein
MELDYTELHGIGQFAGHLSDDSFTTGAGGGSALRGRTGEGVLTEAILEFPGMIEGMPG